MPGFGKRGAGSVAAACLIAAACAHMGGVRPRLVPLAGAEERIVQAGPASVTLAIVATLDTSGIPIEAASAEEGYVESRWIDATTHQPRAPGPSNLDRVIKIRFYADPVAGTTHLVAECVHRFHLDPSLPPRELEVVVPDGHPGKLLLDSLMTRLLTNQRRVERR